MDLVLLSEFTALAKYLNFSRTAQELNLTQPTLSRHIVQLEEELEVQLFRRDRQSVSLTEAGELFLPEALAVLARYDAARRRLAEYRDGMAGSLTIGYRWIYGGGAWPHVLHVFRAQYPQISVRLISFQDNDALQGGLLDGSLDVAVTIRSDDAVASDFQFVTLRAVPLMVALREDHPLARRDVVSPAELGREKLLVPQTRSSLGFPALVNTLFCAHGLTPSVIYSAERLEEALLRVQLDNLAALVPRCYYPDSGIPGVRAVQVTGTTGVFKLLAMARADNPNGAVRLFLQSCRAELKKSWLMEQMESLAE